MNSQDIAIVLMIGFLVVVCGWDAVQSHRRKKERERLKAEAQRVSAVQEFKERRLSDYTGRRD